ncbi:toluene tolerance protein Ttg2D [Verrucomicrobiia bacterium DG1235]|nr:toluene tolerance protein Ttg2D [Verrucomicrobiae bacterium DG1235]
MLLLKRISYLAVLTFALASLPNAQAEESPEKLLEQTISEVLDVLHASDQQISLIDKRTKILDLLQSRFSFDIIIRRALGRNWNLLSDSQQNQITTLISDLLIRAYTRELENGPKPEIKFLRTDDLGSNKIEIVTTVAYKSNFVSVSYRLANIKGRGWQVYDVLIEGISMVSNYRKQFDEHFQTKNAADLLKLLEGKLEE